MRWAAVSALVLAGCADLQPLVAGVCGNGVVDLGEDCDLFAPDGERCGAASEGARACRLACDTASCPAGWGCRPDDVCHHAIGAFREGSDPSSLPADDFSLADVDGDGYLDVVGFGRASVRVLYGDGAGGFGATTTRSLPALTGRAAVGSIDADGRADLAVPYREGVALLLGRADRTLGAWPVAAYLPQQPWLVPIQAASLGPGDALFSFEPRPEALRVSTQRVPIRPGRNPGSFDLPGHRSFETLGARLPVADDDEDSDDEVLLAFQGASELVRCATGAPFVEAQDNRIACPALDLDGRAIAVDGGALFADANGDGVLDAVVAVDDGVAVLPGLGGGGYGPVEVPERLSGLAPPLAAADLDADGDTDWVTAAGIFLDDADTLVQVWDFGAGPTITEAMAVSLAGGDFPDVVAATAEDSVLLLLRDAEGRFTDYELTTEGAPVFLRAGNFDGVGPMDIAFGELHAPGEPDALVILYGPDGWTRPVRIDGVPTIEHLETGRLANSSGSLDGASDLLVESRARPDGRFPLTIFEGTADRDPIAPLAFALNYVPDVPRFALLGRFVVGTAAGDDLVVIADDPAALLDRARLWLAPAEPDARYLVDRTTPLEADELPPPSCPAAWAAVDLDGDGTAEAVSVDCVGAVRALTMEPAGAPAVPWADLEAPTGDFGVALPDLDGDGAVDLVVTDEGEVRIAWGASGGRAEIVARAVTPLEADGDARRELAVLSADAGDVHLGEVVDGAPVFGPEPISIVRGTRMAAGDLDGDGLDDLVVSDGARVTVLLAVSHLDGSALP